jgi:ubiquinone/menaquinone biosynthesis C-methylase UbiE
VATCCTAAAQQPSDHPEKHKHGKPGETQAEAYDRFVEEKLRGTYPATAMRMLAECGGIREGLCIDLGCGSGHLDVELAKRSNLTIIGLDIDKDMKPLFEKRIREAGLQQRVSFVQGDAQKLPFPDHHADIILSRGMLTFLPDIKKCLREVQRVLKPNGVAFLGGRYLYAPKEAKITTEKLKTIVAEANIPGAKLVEFRGQWVKILGPQAPKAAREFQPGPGMLAFRFIADYGITKGTCLILCRADGPLEQQVQQGLLDTSELQITALYPSEKLAEAARARLQQASSQGRIVCKVGDVQSLPWTKPSFDTVVGVGGVPFWKDRAKAFAEIHRVLRPGGAALVGGMYRYMPESRKPTTEALQQAAAKTGIPSIRVYEDKGQWVEILKPR